MPCRCIAELTKALALPPGVLHASSMPPPCSPPRRHAAALQPVPMRSRRAGLPVRPFAAAVLISASLIRCLAWLTVAYPLPNLADRFTAVSMPIIALPPPIMAARFCPKPPLPVAMVLFALPPQGPAGLPRSAAELCLPLLCRRITKPAWASPSRFSPALPPPPAAASACQAPSAAPPAPAPASPATAAARSPPRTPPTPAEAPPPSRSSSPTHLLTRITSAQS